MQFSISIVFLLFSFPCDSTSIFLHQKSQISALFALPQSLFSSRRRNRSQSCCYQTLLVERVGGKRTTTLYLMTTDNDSMNKDNNDDTDATTIWDKIRNPNFDVQTLPPSISHLLSTPQLYAHAYNMTVEEINQYQINYKHSIEQMKETFITQTVKNSDDKIEGKDVHSLQCKIRYTFGRDPFVCKRCWTYFPICVCERAKSKIISKPSCIDKVIIWTHLDEWGKTSNTGSVLSVTLGDEWCNVWMKGLEYHDELMRRMLEDEMILPIVLWPKLEQPKRESHIISDNDINHHQWITTEEIENLMESSTPLQKQRKIVLIAIEGTWRNARRMVKKLPSHVKRLDLKENIYNVVRDGNDSILHPLRSQGDGASQTNVCTAEAVVAALMMLGLSKGDREHILDVATTKIDLVLRFQGKIISQLD